MQKMQKFEGLSQNLIAHLHPVASIPELQEKYVKPSTLIDIVLKSIVEERMSGSLINHERKQRKERYKEPYLKQRLNYSSNLDNLPNKNRKWKLDFQNISPQTNRIVKYQEGLLKSTNHLPSEIQKKRLRNYTSLDKSQKSHGFNSNPQIPQESFISAVEIETSRFKKSPTQQKDLPTNKQNIANNRKDKNGVGLHLPKIKTKSQDKYMLESSKNASVLKSFLKKPADELISADVWKLLSNKELFGMKKRKRRNSAMMSEILGITAKATNKKQIVPPASYQFSSKEQILLFIQSLPNGLKMLCQATINFYEIVFPHECSLRNYANIVEDLKNMNLRGWAFFSFMFWDVEMKGSFTMSDLFLRFRQFQGIKDEEENEKNDTKTKMLIKLKEKTNQLKNVVEAKRILNELIRKLSKDLKQERNGDNQSVILQNESQIKYLQEAFLTKRSKPVLYKEIEPLFNAGKSKSADPSTQIQLVPKDLRVKFSSAYRQSFLATEHNEETRQIRELIETAKLDLIQMKKRRNQELLNNKDNEVPLKKFKNYENYVDEGYGVQIRKIVLMVLGDL